MSGIPRAAREVTIAVGGRAGDVSGLLLRPPDAHALFALAHGAGADMRHVFLEALATRCAERGVATLRYQFPYAERGGRRPDPGPVLRATVRAAVARASSEAAGIPLVAGGKSMGGRMTSLAASEEPLAGVRGLVFVGFPLHAAGHPSSERGEHLDGVPLPMLFLQGTRDRLAELDLVRPLCQRLGTRARLHVVADGDHSFRVRKRSGRGEGEVMDELAGSIEEFTRAPT